MCRDRPFPASLLIGTSLRAMSDPAAQAETVTNKAEPIDLDAIETDLADVEIALARLESGTYWTCEISGQPLSDELLAQRPTARRDERLL